MREYLPNPQIRNFIESHGLAMNIPVVIRFFVDSPRRFVMLISQVSMKNRSHPYQNV